MKNIDVNPATCILCGICASSCPTDAIRVDKVTRTWEISHRMCMKCGLCVTQCPKESLSFTEADDIRTVREIPPRKPTKKLLKKKNLRKENLKTADENDRE